jgi:hypothetical protein
MIVSRRTFLQGMGITGAALFANRAGFGVLVNAYQVRSNSSGRLITMPFAIAGRDTQPGASQPHRLYVPFVGAGHE